MKLNALIILILTLGLTYQTTQAQTLCSQKSQISDVKKAGDKSSFELKLSSSDIYSGKLVEINGTDQTVIQTFSGHGNLEKAFKNLKESQYRIILDFKNETKFLCKQKTLMIDLIDTQ